MDVEYHYNSALFCTWKHSRVWKKSQFVSIQISPGTTNHIGEKAWLGDHAALPYRPRVFICVVVCMLNSSLFSLCMCMYICMCTGLGWHFGICAYSSSCRDTDEKMGSTVTSIRDDPNTYFLVSDMDILIQTSLGIVKIKLPHYTAAIGWITHNQCCTLMEYI